MYNVLLSSSVRLIGGDAGVLVTGDAGDAGDAGELDAGARAGPATAGDERHRQVSLHAPALGLATRRGD